MKQNTDAVDPRPSYMITEMAEHFEEFEAEYRTEPQHHEVVYEDDEVVIVADHTGHELGEWASDYGIDYGELSQAFHTLARQVCNYSWSVSDPIVFEKFEQ
jgi:hypothetical protein